MFTRPFPNLPALTMVAIASGATSLVAPSNAGRVELKLQGADAFWLGAASGVPSGALGMPGLFQPSGVQVPISHTGPVFAFSGAANGATIALRIWETSV